MNGDSCVMEGEGSEGMMLMCVWRNRDKGRSLRIGLGRRGVDPLREWEGKRVRVRERLVCMCWVYGS